jgi:hypothetical protein
MRIDKNANRLHHPTTPNDAPSRDQSFNIHSLVQLVLGAADVGVLDMDTIVLLEAGCHNRSLHLLKIDMRNFSLVAIKDLGNFFESRAAGFNVEEEDEDEFEEDPDLASNVSLCNGGTGKWGWLTE